MVYNFFNYYFSGDTFEIMPSNGTLDPGSFIELKLTLLASTEPSEY